MKIMNRPAILMISIALTMAFIASPAFGQVLISDDFEDRAQDQPTIGNNWTWYDMTFAGDECTGEPIAEFGPFSDGDDSDYVADNRNFWTADVANGGDGNYYRAGLEVPAWEGAFSNMLRVFGNVYNTATSCQRVHVFRELTIEQAGVFAFSYDVVKDVTGDLVNGGSRAGFMKVLDPNNGFEEVMFEIVDSDPPEAGMASRVLEFEIPAEFLGMLMQVGFYTDYTPNLGQTWDIAGALYDNVVLEVLNIGPAHSGSFFNLDQSGHGFSVEFGEFADGTPIAVIYWYTYDSMGNNVFLIGIGTPVGNRVEVTFESALGMQYGVWDPQSVMREANAGTGVFEFVDRDNAVFSYTPSEFSQTNFGHMMPVEDLPLIKLIGIPANRQFSNPVLP